jgi:hypothetical protein
MSDRRRRRLDPQVRSTNESRTKLALPAMAWCPSQWAWPRSSTALEVPVECGLAKVTQSGFPQSANHCLLLEDVDCSRDHESQDDE